MSTILIVMLTLLVAVILVTIGLWIGLTNFTYVLHWRASRSDGIIDGVNFDLSNRANVQSLIAHFGTHPEDFILMQYADGKKPFAYMNKDLVTDINDSRPNKK